MKTNNMPAKQQRTSNQNKAEKEKLTEKELKYLMGNGRQILYRGHGGAFKQR